MSSSRGAHVVVCGLPASGKTTLCHALGGALERADVVPEDIDWVGGSSGLPAKAKDRAQKREVQAFFLKLDLARAEFARQAAGRGRIAVADTDWLTTLCFCWAESLATPELDVFDWVRRQYRQAWIDGRLPLADHYLFLDAPDETRLSHSRHDGGRRRNAMFFGGVFAKAYGRAHRFFFDDRNAFRPTACSRLDASLREDEVLRRALDALRRGPPPATATLDEALERLTNRIDDDGC